MVFLYIWCRPPGNANLRAVETYCDIDSESGGVVTRKTRQTMSGKGRLHCVEDVRLNRVMVTPFYQNHESDIE